MSPCARHLEDGGAAGVRRQPGEDRRDRRHRGLVRAEQQERPAGRGVPGGGAGRARMGGVGSHDEQLVARGHRARPAGRRAGVPVPDQVDVELALGGAHRADGVGADRVAPLRPAAPARRRTSRRSAGSAGSRSPGSGNTSLMRWSSPLSANWSSSSPVKVTRTKLSPRAGRSARVPGRPRTAPCRGGRWRSRSRSSAGPPQQPDEVRAPIRAVTRPAGIWAGAMTVRPRVSATLTSSAPSRRPRAAGGRAARRRARARHAVRPGRRSRARRPRRPRSR